jgi:hypothetical protein
VRPVTSHVPNSAGRLDSHLALISAAFESSARPTRDLLGAEGIDVLFIDAPGGVIPEWGIGGSTYGPHVIVVAVDPEFPGLSEEHLVSTLVHEFHHAMRWRGPGAGGPGTAPAAVQPGEVVSARRASRGCSATPTATASAGPSPVPQHSGRRNW